MCIDRRISRCAVCLQSPRAYIAHCAAVRFESDTLLSMIGVTLVVAICAQMVLDVRAHGYVNWPPSRSYNCKTGAASDCGEIQWEPQSVEAIKGLPFARTGAANSLCSAGISRFSQLDRTSWPSADAADVSAFTWTFTAMHATTNFQYFLTKQGWDSSTGLDASDLDSVPFLIVDMNGAPPGATETHAATLPARSGHHVVYAVWTIDNTNNAFYQCIDLNFPSTAASGAAQKHTCSNRRRASRHTHTQ